MEMMAKRCSLCSESIVERGIQWLRANWVPFVFSFVTGFLTYGFALTNKLTNYDEVHSLFGKGATLESGRWGLDVLSYVFPDVSMPWLYGIISLFFMALSVCLVVRIFEIKRKVFQILLSGLIISFPSLIGTMAYMYTSASYAVAFYLAVLAVWVLRGHRKWDAVLAGMLTIASLSIYQAYLAVAASFLVLLLLQRTLRHHKIKEILLQGVRSVLVLGCSMVVYYLITKVLQKVLQVPMGSYAKVNIDLGISDLLSKVGYAYYHFLMFFVVGFRGLIPTAFSRVIHVVLMIILGVIDLRWMFRTKKVSYITLFLLLLGILPLSIGTMYLCIDHRTLHTLVMYSFVAVYVGAMILVEHHLDDGEKKNKSILADLSAVCALLIVSTNISIGNQAFLQMHLKYENTYAFYTSLMSDLRRNETFAPGTKLAIIGDYDVPDHYEENFSDLKRIMGVGGVEPTDYSNGEFVKYYLGVDIAFATGEEVAAIEATEEFQQMACYPYHGSVQTIDGILVVKLSG